MRKTKVRRISLRRTEAVLLAIGLALLATFLGFRVHSMVASRLALRRFADSNRAKSLAQPELQNTNAPLWSDERIDAYKKSLKANVDDPIAVLSIPRISLEVPVFEGTDEIVLNRGLGRVEGTARPGETGNIGIAGHRDGFFRALKDIKLGDRIEMSTLKGKTTYVVEETKIVPPEDVSVLEPRKSPSLTLVTCYPFYFVGHAPKRFIVHASILVQNQQTDRQIKSRTRDNQHTGGQ